MAELKQPAIPIAATRIGATGGPPVETVAEAHPAVLAYSSTESPAISGTHTAGGTAIHGVSSNFAGMFQGHVQITGNLNVSGDIFLPGADVAEQFEVAGGMELEPGTLVAMDASGGLRPCMDAYEKAVIGVVAGAGRYRPGLILDSSAAGGCVRVSLVGKAFCFADASYGEIAVGDLLTTSATPGHAMKASDPARAFGAVVGKALQPLAAGMSTIAILVALK